MSDNSGDLLLIDDLAAEHNMPVAELLAAAMDLDHQADLDLIDGAGYLPRWVADRVLNYLTRTKQAA